MIKALISFVLFLFLIIVSTANAVTPISDPHGPSGEWNLYRVVNAMMGTSFTSSAQLAPYEIECDAWWHEWDGFIRIYATYAGYNQNLYWENSTSSGFILSASADGLFYPDVHFYTTGGNFYFKDVTTGGTWYSLDSMNSDGKSHMVTYHFGNDVYICGFEDYNGLGDKDYNDLVFKITYGAAPCCVPTVSDIPDQKIWKCDDFTTIPLDVYVTDCDHNDSQIIWTCSGQVDCTCNIDSNRVATITCPHCWTGSETITFTARDPDGHTDSDPATFTVQPNEAPIVSDIPNQTIVRGGNFATVNLDNYVHDPDNPDWQITWSWSGNVNLIVNIVNRVATITYPPGWMGSETITFTATDPHNCSDSDSAIFAVTCGTTCKSPCSAVGGIVIPINKFGLLSP